MKDILKLSFCIFAFILLTIPLASAATEQSNTFLGKITLGISHFFDSIFSQKGQTRVMFVTSQVNQTVQKQNPPEQITQTNEELLISQNESNVTYYDEKQTYIPEPQTPPEIGYQSNKTEMQLSAFSIPSSSDVKKTEINKNFVGNSIYKISFPNKITSVSIDGEVILNDDTSFARIILSDTNGNEYLIFGTDYTVYDPGKTEFNNVCDETCILDPITPASIRIELQNAEVNIKSINFLEESMNIKAGGFKISQAQIKDNQVNEKIKKINENNKKENLDWVAGDNPIFRMSYSEKKKLFGGELPDLYGFDAYKEGYFELPENTKNIQIKSAPEDVSIPLLTFSTLSINLPASFDWSGRYAKNWNNENWMTDVRSQRNCGSCWVFGSIGAFEGLINLYYNQHLNINLSEQQIISCGGFPWTGCSGGFASSALSYIKNKGVVDENCFTYTATDNKCGNICSDWSSREFWSNGYSKISHNEIDTKRAIITKGPIVASVSPLSHIMTTTGYGTRLADGKTYWIMKNSWGPYYDCTNNPYCKGNGLEVWGENGYVKIIASDLSLINFYTINTPIDSSLSQKYQIKCEDKDKDGYCFWGISPQKPSTCPSYCKNEEDDDDTVPKVTIPSSNNTVPMIISTPVTSVMIGALYTYDVDAIDINTKDILTYSLVLAPSGMSISPTNGVITWIPDNSQVGINSIQVKVNDNNGGSAMQSFVITVTGQSVSKPDLTVSNFYLSNLNPLPNEAFEASFKIRNVGTQSIGNFEYNMKIMKWSDTVKSETDTYSSILNAGTSSDKITKQFSLDTGNYKIILTLDPNNDLDELNKTNNVQTQVFEVKASAPSCTDTDGEVNYDVKGICSDQFGQNVADLCLDANKLGEWSCVSGRCIYQEHSCNCASGTCISGSGGGGSGSGPVTNQSGGGGGGSSAGPITSGCTDIDGGANYNVKGHCSDPFGQSVDDLCIDINKLWEWKCISNRCVYEEHTCSCQSGKCI